VKDDVKNMTYPKKSDLNTVKERLNFDIPPQTAANNPIYSVPNNNFQVQILPPQTNFFRQIPQQNELPRATFTASNYIPNLPIPQSNQFPNPNPIPNPVLNPSSFVQHIPEPIKIQGNAAAPIWKFDSILKNEKK
jgi:hypothetical protein